MHVVVEQSRTNNIDQGKSRLCIEYLEMGSDRYHGSKEGEEKREEGRTDGMERHEAWVAGRRGA